MTEISGKVAVVTGGGSGIGRAIALGLASEGASVAIGDIILENAEKVAGEIEAAGGRAAAIQCDVTDPATISALHDEVGRKLDPASLLVANAGAIMVDPLLDMSEQDIEWIVQTSLHGTINCLRAFLPGMKQRGDGHVLVTSSACALIPLHLGRNPAYVAAKMGVFGMMLHMRQELHDAGIGSTVLCPGAVTTGFAHSPASRPARFGEARVKELPKADANSPIASMRPSMEKFRPAEEVAAMAIAAIREDRAVVVTDATHRAKFTGGVVDLVLSAFDDVDNFDAAHQQE